MDGATHRDTAGLAQAIRAHAVRMVHRAGSSHIGSCLSAADLLAVLYGSVLRVDPVRPDWDGRDRFILSKGHAAAALYAVLAERGFFPAARLEEYGRDGSALTGHVSHHVPGVEFSTGSLGHGLPAGCGMALAAHRDDAPWRVFVLLSDGELDEGSTWESILFAAHHGLDRLTAVVDANRWQACGRTSEVLNLEPLGAKFESFGWSVADLDGHDHTALSAALNGVPLNPGRPTVVIARTVKGRGVSFMEDSLKWHYQIPGADDVAAALKELGASGSTAG